MIPLFPPVFNENRLFMTLLKSDLFFMRKESFITKFVVNHKNKNKIIILIALKWDFYNNHRSFSDIEVFCWKDRTLSHLLMMEKTRKRIEKENKRCEHLMVAIRQDNTEWWLIINGICLIWSVLIIQLTAVCHSIWKRWEFFTLKFINFFE